MNHQEPDEYNEEKKAKRVYTLRVTILVSLIWIIIFVAVLITTRIDNTSVTDSYLSNLTNTSIVQGYIVGYAKCQEGMMTLINQSLSTCQLIRANISGVPVELIPTSCIK